MGAYVNPPNEQKEDWLFNNALKLDNPPVIVDVESGRLPVCLVNNGMFTAAGVCYSQMELDAFADKDDIRPKVWFLAPIDKLKTVSNIEQYLTKKPVQTPR